MWQKPVEWEEVNRLFGDLVEKKLRENDVTLEKTLLGGLVVIQKNGFFLDERRLLKKKKKVKKPTVIKDNHKYYEREEHVLKFRPEAYDLDDEDNFDLFVNFRRTFDLSSGSVIESSHHSFATNSRTSIVTAACSNLSTRKSEQNDEPRRIPRYINHPNYNTFRSNMFTIDSNTIDKFREFMGPDAGGYELCLPLVESIYEKFLKRHKRFGYKYILRNIPQDESSMNGQISQRQLRAYFRQIFWAVVPVELFGDKKNLNKVRKMVNKYFQTSFGEYFSAQAVTNHLNINAIEWLRIIEDQNTKISIISQLVESFFAKYIMAVLGTYIYTEKMTWSNEKIFFRLDHWIHHTKKYCAQQKANGVYEEIKQDELENYRSRKVPAAVLTLHVKKQGIRPLLSICPSRSQKKEASILNTLLYQMFLKKFELINPQKLEKLWRNIHETYSGKEDRPLYFVSCDIHDAFGSINLQKLLDIIFAMMDELDDKLTLQNFTIFNPRAKSARYIRREYFDTPLLPLSFPARTLCYRYIGKPNTIMDKQWLKSRMESHILHRKVTINGDPYCQMKGIGQGIPLTSLLCEIYYGTMALEELGSFMNFGHLWRYVDDFLYFTEDKTSAERFLKQVHKGIATYDCSFNTAKTSTNLPPYCANEFVYLGYRFNTQTFDVSPEFSNVVVRYTINLSISDPSKAFFILRKRLESCLCLKVHKIVLDPSINSNEAIRKTIHEISTMSARRCSAFLMSMVEINEIPGPRIFKIVKYHSVYPLCLQISKLCFSTTNVADKDFKNLKNSVWQVYFKTFQRNAYLFKIIGPRMKILLRRLQSR